MPRACLCAVSDMTQEYNWLYPPHLQLIEKILDCVGQIYAKEGYFPLVHIKVGCVVEFLL